MHNFAKERSGIFKKSVCGGQKEDNSDFIRLIIPQVMIPGK